MKCLGTKSKQGDWKCFSCLFTSGGNDGCAGTGTSAGAARSRGAGMERMLDMNAPPPEEEEVECWGGGGELGRVQGKELYSGGYGYYFFLSLSFLSYYVSN